MNILATLTEIIAARASSDTDKSWTATLLQKGRPTIAQKVGEEAVETVIAAMQNDKEEVIKESADLLYHLAVLWHEMGVDLKEIAAELNQRQGQSGLVEKAGR